MKHSIYSCEHIDIVAEITSHGFCKIKSGTLLSGYLRNANIYKGGTLEQCVLIGGNYTNIKLVNCTVKNVTVRTGIVTYASISNTIMIDFIGDCVQIEENGIMIDSNIQSIYMYNTTLAIDV